MQICPYCASRYILFSKKHNIYFCEDCEKRFDNPGIEKGMRLFISYGHDKNATLVHEIKEFLTDKGYDVWIDTSEIPKGRDWRECITNGLLASNGVLAFLSKYSVRDPGVCRDEIRIALRLKHSMVKSILLEDKNEVQPSSRISANQWIDMEDWRDIPKDEWDEYFKTKMDELLSALESEENTEYAGQIDLLSKMLNVVDHLTKEQKLLQQTFVGREWLMAEVNHWLCNMDSQKMMIYGVPGSGKSAFAANIAQYSPDVLASIYFEWDNPFYSDTDKVICQLAFKIACNLTDYRNMLCNMLQDFAKAKELIADRHKAALFDALILDPINCCINGNRSNYVIVFDGLDETTEEIAQLLYRKADSFPDWIKCLFLSRYEETSAPKYANADPVILLDQESENNRNDILYYMSETLNLDKDDVLCQRLTDKCEGSFIYARTLSDGIYSGAISYDEIDILPKGFNEFYYVFFQRLFPTRESFKLVHTFLELLVTGEELPFTIICQCLNIDQYELWEIRDTLKSLIITVPFSDPRYKLKIVKFVHKTFKDWMTSQEKAGKFFVNPQNGFKKLADTAKPYFDGAAVFNNEKDADDMKYIIWIYRNRYPMWLVKSGQCRKYEKLLLESFDEQRMDDFCRENISDYTKYYELYDLWRYADLLPMDYPVDALIAKLKEIVVYPKKYLVSRFAHRSFQITSLTLAAIMDSGRFRDVFYTFANLMNFAGYFSSMASEDGETRDGWDKYYMTRDMCICIKKLERNHITIPSLVRNRCECMKLYYNYVKDSMFGHIDSNDRSDTWVYGILTEQELFKNICVLDDDLLENTFSDIRKQRSEYNTLSLTYYLACSDEEDMDFINLCIKNLADVKKACRRALKSIEENDFRRVRPKHENRRVEFIRRLNDRKFK